MDIQGNESNQINSLYALSILCLSVSLKLQDVTTDREGHGREPGSASQHPEDLTKSRTWPAHKVKFFSRSS